MGVHRRVAVLVLYAEKLSARAVLADFRHRSGRKADDIVAGVCCEIHAVVELCLVVDRVQPVAEIGGYSGGKRLNEGEFRHGRVVGDIGRNAEIDERLLLFHKRRHRLFNGGDSSSVPAGSVSPRNSAALIVTVTGIAASSAASVTAATVSSVL